MLICKAHFARLQVLGSLHPLSPTPCRSARHDHCRKASCVLPGRRKLLRRRGDLLVPANLWSFRRPLRLPPPERTSPFNFAPGVPMVDVQTTHQSERRHKPAAVLCPGTTICLVKIKATAPLVQTPRHLENAKSVSAAGAELQPLLGWERLVAAEVDTAHGGSILIVGSSSR